MSTARAADEDNNNTNESAGSGCGGGVDTTLLLGGQTLSRPYLRWLPSLRRAMSRWMMREPSRRVREAAAEQIQERQTDLAYSKPVVVLDLIWNIVFVAVSISMLIISRNERPSMPLRLWVVGYVLLCLLHVACMCLEYRKQRQQRDSRGDSSWRSGGGSSTHNGSGRWNSGNSSSGSDEGDYGSDRRQNDEKTSVAKHLDSANTIVLLIWWIMGIYWVSAGGPSLTQDSPQLYRLCITFLALDVFFVFIWVAVTCVVRIAVRCCLPWVIAILYAVTNQEGATKEDIERLPKYKFRRFGDPEKQNDAIHTATPSAPPLEDDECCICLCTYDDGTELHELPCRHLFHSDCIDKWLYVNATCPLCKQNILKNGNLSGNEEA